MWACCVSEPTLAFAKPVTACVYAELGDRDRVFAWLERTWRVPAIYPLKVGPAVDPIRGDPRYAELRRRLDLAD
jgi:hypothetical protein